MRFVQPQSPLLLPAFPAVVPCKSLILQNPYWCSCRFASAFQKLAGAEGFEPPSSVLETDSLTVELTPLKTVILSRLLLAVEGSERAARKIARLARFLISLLCAAYASGNGGRTSSSPAARSSSCGSWSSNSCALCNHRTAS